MDKKKENTFSSKWQFVSKLLCFFSIYFGILFRLCYNGCMTLQEQLKEKDNFTENEKIIADYILSHKDDVLQMSIQSLALKTYTSTSAIMRLCTRLNLVGFKDFKFRFSQELLRPNTDYNDVDPNFPFSKNDSIPEISQQLKKLTIQTLQETQKMLSTQDMKKACILMKNAKHVALFGVGDAYLAGLAFQASMTRAGTNYIVTPVYGEQGHLAKTLYPEDCALLLSYSGSSENTVNSAKTLKRRKVPTICITANQNSELAKICDITLFLPAKEDRGHRIAAFFSRASMEYYLNVMYSYLYVLDYDKHIKETTE